MDKLQQMIMEKKAEVEDLRSRISVLEAEVAALELADKLRPVTVSSPGRPASQGGARSSGGRRKGDISKVWRGILKGIYDLGAPVDYDTVEMIARKQGQELALSSIRDRVRNMVKTGLMVGDVQSGFTVTEDAAERFGFAKENEPPDGGSETGGAATPPDPGGQSAMPGLLTNAPQAADLAPHSGREGGD